MRSVLPIVALSLAACSTPSRYSVDAREVVLERIVFGSCCDHRVAQPIWDAVFAARPDLVVMTGDNLYADADTAEQLRQLYADAFAQPGLHRLVRDFRVLATYDDHDFGRNDSGRENPIRDTSAALCLDAFRVPADDPRRSRPGVYGAYRYGPPGRCVQVIVLDTRYFRDPLLTGPDAMREGYGNYMPHIDPARTLLGDDQWRWLRDVLSEPADLRLLVSSVQVLSDEHRREGWGNFPYERRRLDQLIRETRADGVLILSGDVHYAELSIDRGFDYPLIDFTSSAMAHVHNTADGAPTPYSSVGNRHRVAGTSYTAANFGRIDIDWDGGGDPEITLSLRRFDGSPVFEHRVRLGDLRHRSR